MTFQRSIFGKFIRKYYRFLDGKVTYESNRSHESADEMVDPYERIVTRYYACRDEITTIFFGDTTPDRVDYST